MDLIGDLFQRKDVPLDEKDAGVYLHGNVYQTYTDHMVPTQGVVGTIELPPGQKVKYTYNDPRWFPRYLPEQDTTFWTY